MAILQPVIMAGGKGTRLWPLSRSAKPKQFLPLASKEALLADAAARVSLHPGARAPWVVTGEEYRFAARDALENAGIHPDTILLEPVGRSTAAVAAVSALLAERAAPDTIIVLLAADHVIPDSQAFNHALERAIEVAQEGMLALFGVMPTSLSTRYGYIQYGDPIGDPISAGVSEVIAFVEKPDAASAARFVARGQHLWNTGNFVFRADAMLKEFASHAPDILVSCEAALFGARREGVFLHLDAKAMEQCRSISLDRAIMEKTDRAVVVHLDAPWADIGTWGALWELADKNTKGNVVHGDAVLENCQGLYVRTQRSVVGALGIRDLVIVEDGDAILVVPRERDHDVGALVERMRAFGRPEVEVARKVERPWGSYEVLHQGEGFQVKLIEVKPGEALSLQYHFKRAEYWVVVRGRPRVTVGDKVDDYGVGETILIPLQSAHRLENPTQAPVAIIEVQLGSYLGEDDIVRLEDRYNRV